MLQPLIPCSREDVMAMVNHRSFHRHNHWRGGLLNSFLTISCRKERSCPAPKGQISLDLDSSSQLATLTSSSPLKHSRRSWAP